MEQPVLPERMNVAKFRRWLDAHAGDRRFELSDGEIVALASERAIHARLKAEAFSALQTAASGLSCEVFVDGMAVEIGDRTQREPDAALQCGDPLPPDAMFYTDPIVLVEVLSLSTSSLDTNAKFAEYTQIESLAHYLTVDPSRKIVVAHRRTPDGFVAAILPGGPLCLDPPGITLDLDAVLAPLNA
ncbi:Uma2 family endonuclease [Jannaschia sp. LMIT008]|uniref:Uma2 family endonuclease n=1 Tax=Jannaschia maritima TaxID=3032585 RepID=UPI0028119E23|nr:Uma2 family endonuclease [Jannaschia sp. LMIT008]